jgi:alpha-D-xyloside xylohydrolase
MRLHGERLPHREPLGKTGGGQFFSGSDNEIWSYGEEACGIFEKYIRMRERLKPYITRLMRGAHEKGTPVIRPLFYDFPEDKAAWKVDDQYMFGPDLLVAPVLYDKQRTRKVTLPDGAVWRNAFTGESFEGGCTVECDAPLDVIPLFLRNGVSLPIL